MSGDPERGKRPILDLHVHVGPELLKRRYTIDSLAEEAKQGFFGFAAKNHFQPTTAWAARISHRYNFPVIGSICLNKGVGGINSEALRAALSGFKADPRQAKRDEGRFIVWMPTIHAESHLAQNRRKDIDTSWGCAEEHQVVYPEGTGLSVLDEEQPNQLSKETRAVLDIIAREDLILATGHLSAHEVELLVREASVIGIKRIIITHPFFRATNMPLVKQVELSKIKGVFIELAYINLEIDAIPIRSYTDLIKEAGSENIILSSDLGQITTATVSEGWRHYFKLLKKQGISKDQFIQMSSHNPYRIAVKEGVP